LPGAIGHHHNKRQRIVHTEENIGREEEQHGGAVSENMWTFLGFWAITPQLQGTFSHHHNRQKIVHTEERVEDHDYTEILLIGGKMVEP